MLSGQWVGSFKGVAEGHATQNVELVNGLYVGRLALIDDSPERPSLVCRLRLKEEGGRVQGELHSFLPVNPQTGLPDEWENVKPQFPNFSIPRVGALSAHCEPRVLAGEWKTDVSSGTFTVFKSESDLPSEFVADPIEWEDFKEYLC